MISVELQVIFCREPINQSIKAIHNNQVKGLSTNATQNKNNFLYFSCKQNKNTSIDQLTIIIASSLEHAISEVSHDFFSQRNVYQGACKFCPWHTRTFRCKKVLILGSCIFLSLQQTLMKLHIFTKFCMINRAGGLFFVQMKNLRKCDIGKKKRKRPLTL